ncbi:hypothetical protein AA0118_g6975 [Alternaria tenuissima]|jgi:hypothetical protein|nr:hypothetical protein AA0118_g6975 [Alternaria tenuissima]
MVGIDVNGFGYVDVLNTLGLDPRVIRVVDLTNLERRRWQAAFSLHPDRLRKQPPPAHTSLERLNALVEYIADYPASTARLIKQLNERATIGLHNTHRLSNFFP